MKAALICNLAVGDSDANQLRILELAAKAVEMGAGLLLFGEAAATGLCNTGQIEHDLGIAEPIPGPRNGQWQGFAREHGVYFVAGLLEREGGRIYDSAVLFDPHGESILHYRRNHPGWHHPEDDPHVYQEGLDVPVVDAEFGRVGILICGDLWSDEILARFSALQPDYLLYPFLRSLEKSVSVEDVWPQELQCYRQRWSRTGAVTLAVNLFEGTGPEQAIGGAWVVDRKGEVIDSLPIGQEGILLVDLPA